MMLWLYVNMCVYVRVVCIVWMAMRMVFNSALRMFGYPGNLSKICILWWGLYVLDHDVSPST